MGGGLMQLVAYGAQDIYLTGNPQITFFKVVYRRHTNFSMESIEQTFNGSSDFGKKVTCTISRNGDLVHRVYLQVTIGAMAETGNTQLKWVDRVGYALIDNVEVEIGGQRIDKHYGVWMEIWSELTHCHQMEQCLDKMIHNTGVGAKTYYVPLQFWFCRNPGCALPLIALQYHEVKINLTMRSLAKLHNNLGSALTTTPTIDSASLWVDYIYLDTDERRRFAQVSHEYLIEQLQFTGEETASSKHKLNFNHRVKELVWVTRNDNNVTSNEHFNYDGGVSASGVVDMGTGTPTDTQTVIFNGVTITFEAALSDTSGNPNTINIQLDAGAGKNADNLVLAINGAADAAGVIDFATALLGAGNGVPGHTAQKTGTDTVKITATTAGSAGNVAAHTGNATVAIALTNGKDSGNPTSKAKLQLNGHDRFAERPGTYFNNVQPYQHHSGNPKSGINCYSFGLTPEEHQPSGTCNMSRIDNATLQIVRSNSEASKTSIFALNYNVLRIMSGMGGLAYSN